MLSTLEENYGGSLPKAHADFVARVESQVEEASDFPDVVRYPRLCAAKCYRRGLAQATWDEYSLYANFIKSTLSDFGASGLLGNVKTAFRLKVVYAFEAYAVGPQGGEPAHVMTAYTLVAGLREKPKHILYVDLEEQAPARLLENLPASSLEAPGEAHIGLHLKMRRLPFVCTRRSDVPKCFSDAFQEAGQLGRISITEDDELAQRLVPDRTVKELRASVLTFRWTGRETLTTTGVDDRLCLRRYLPSPWRGGLPEPDGAAGGRGRGAGDGRRARGRGGRGGEPREILLDFDRAVSGVAPTAATSSRDQQPRPPAASSGQQQQQPLDNENFGELMAEMVEDGIPVWDPNAALQEALEDWVPDNTEVLQGGLWIKELLADAETNEEEDALVEQREADQAAATETETFDTEGAMLRKLWTKYADSTPEISYKSKYSYYHRPQSLQRVCLGRIDMLGHVHKCTCNIHHPPCVIFISSMLPPSGDQ